MDEPVGLVLVVGHGAEQLAALSRAIADPPWTHVEPIGDVGAALGLIERRPPKVVCVSLAPRMPAQRESVAVTPRRRRGAPLDLQTVIRGGDESDPVTTAQANEARQRWHRSQRRSTVRINNLRRRHRTPAPREAKVDEAVTLIYEISRRHPRIGVVAIVPANESRARRALAAGAHVTVVEKPRLSLDPSTQGELAVAVEGYEIGDLRKAVKTVANLESRPPRAPIAAAPLPHDCRRTLDLETLVPDRRIVAAVQHLGLSQIKRDLDKIRERYGLAAVRSWLPNAVRLAFERGEIESIGMRPANQDDADWLHDLVESIARHTEWWELFFRSNVGCRAGHCEDSPIRAWSSRHRTMSPTGLHRNTSPEWRRVVQWAQSRVPQSHYNAA